MFVCARLGPHLKLSVRVRASACECECVRVRVRVRARASQLSLVHCELNQLALRIACLLVDANFSFALQRNLFLFFSSFFSNNVQMDP